MSPGEHPKLSQTSYLRFREVRVESAASIQALVHTQLMPAGDASPPLLLKLQQAVVRSKAVNQEAQEILMAQGVTLQSAATE